jgi:hypothetical protein
VAVRPGAMREDVCQSGIHRTDLARQWFGPAHPFRKGYRAMPLFGLGTFGRWKC